MRAAHIIEIVTPKGVLLNGLWIGPKKPERVIVMMHGLMSNAFSMRRALILVDSKTAVITFNNRGHGQVNYFTRRKPHSKKSDWILGGCAHEIFTDCVDDIEGALNFVRGHGVKNIYLAGHSTGCQKSVYFASHGKLQSVKGLMLFAPISDYASQRALDKKGVMMRALKAAKKLIAEGKPHEMLPAKVSGEFQCDAQRFESLYSGASAEEVFPYWHPTRAPKALQKVRIPILVLLAENDEYSDRPAEKIEEWLLEHIHEGEVVVVPEVEHGFKGGETEIRKSVARFVKGQ